MTPLLHMRVYEPLAAVVLALLVAVLAVRALGQTDLNPVSGVGKLSQVGLLRTSVCWYVLEESVLKCWHMVLRLVACEDHIWKCGSRPAVGSSHFTLIP